MTQPRAVMPSLREAATQALEVMEAADVDPHSSDAVYKAITALRAALVEGGGNLPPPLQEPKDFDHAIGADRFKVVRGAFWWHVLIGDSPTEHGKFRSRASAEKMAADLLREFRNGAFVQHEAALAEPCPCGDRPAAQCPGEWEPGCDLGNNPKYAKRVEMTPKELAASIKRGEKWKVAEPVQEPVAFITPLMEQQMFDDWCPYKGSPDPRHRAGAWDRRQPMSREVCGICWCPYDEDTGECACAPPATPNCPNCASLEAQNTELDRKLAEMEEKLAEMEEKLNNPSVDDAFRILAEANRRAIDYINELERQINELKRADRRQE